MDGRDHIWVYHRPRALSTTDSGAQGAAGKDARGVPISAMGHPRPFGQLSGCCVPAPSVLEFDKAGTLLQAWGGPADPGFLDKKCRAQDGCTWPAREHGIFVDHQGFVYVSGNGQAANFRGQFPWAPSFGNDSHILKFRSDGTFVYQIGTAGAKGPNSNDTNGGINGTPQPFLVADMTVDPKTNRLYVADGYGNRRVLIVGCGHRQVHRPLRRLWAEPGGRRERRRRRRRRGTVGGRLPQGRAEAARSSAARCTAPRSPTTACCTCATAATTASRSSAPPRRASRARTRTARSGKCGFVGEMPVAPQTASGTSGAVSLSTDARQTCLYVADLTNDTIYVVNRQNRQELSRVGTGGRQAGNLHWPHVVGTDTEGNIYTGEVDGAGRVQKYLRYGPASCTGTGQRRGGPLQDRCRPGRPARVSSRTR